jgi:hypothetical protein
MKIHALLLSSILLISCKTSTSTYVCDLCHPSHGPVCEPCVGDCYWKSPVSLCCIDGECRVLTEEEDVTRSPKCDGGIVGACFNYYEKQEGVYACADVPWLFSR